MISTEDILELHACSLSDFGGASGVRDNGMLESPITRPFQSFDGKELYASPYEKAAALAESLIVNHPFADGNKRTGMLAMIALLKEYHIEMKADSAALYACIIAVATGSLNQEQLTGWLKENTSSL